MGDDRRCPGCGTSISAASPGGLCPSCLFALALPGGEDTAKADEDILPGPVYRVLAVLASDTDRTTYLAEQDEPRRMVTLDVVRLGDQAGAAEACQRRVRLLGRLRHPSMARVLEGRLMPSGDFCVVARHVPGRRLDQYCGAKRLPAAERARLFLALCDVVAFAHGQGVCHGRLGPAAVVVSEGAGHRVVTLAGFTVTPGHEPVVLDDVAGLLAIARAAGWKAAGGGRGWGSLDALCAAVSGGWE
jgi:hypothetical protein